MAMAKEWNIDMEGRLSVLSTPVGIPATFPGKGSSTMVAVVSAREFAMNDLVAGVVKKVTVIWRLRRR